MGSIRNSRILLLGVVVSTCLGCLVFISSERIHI